jgi:hypothetical protein
MLGIQQYMTLYILFHSGSIRSESGGSLKAGFPYIPELG